MYIDLSGQLAEDIGTQQPGVKKGKTDEYTDIFD